MPSIDELYDEAQAKAERFEFLYKQLVKKFDKLEADTAELQAVYKETLDSYNVLKERNRKVMIENIEMQTTLQKIYIALHDYKEGRF